MNKPLSKAEIAEQLMTRPEGATMDEILAATGGSWQYTAKRRLEARGYTIRTAKEGRVKRYFAEPPEVLECEATLTSKGQVTIPKAVRERLRLRSGQKVRFILQKDGRVELAPQTHRLSDLFGILGKPPRSVTLEEMDEAIKRGAVERYLRSTR